MQGGWSLSQLSLGEWQGTPWIGRRSIPGPSQAHTEANNHAHSLLLDLESPKNLKCSRRTCKLHTEKPGFEAGTLLL